MLEKLKSVPDSPGVYLFYNSGGKVIYVGKAKSLKNRLLSHFRSTDPSEKSYRIVKSAADFDFLIVRNEREALAVESELIKKHLPKFNVLLKDDKTYPYIVLTDEEFPVLKLVRKHDGVDGKKFGPFIPPKNGRLMLELLNKTFKLRKCKELKKRNKPCIQYHIERCLAPCAGYVSKKEYKEQVDGVVSFLEGNIKTHLKNLYEKIERLSESFEFERAAFLRDQFIALKNIYEKYSVFIDTYPDCDVFYLIKRSFLFEGLHLIVRNGVVVGKEEFTFDPLESWEDMGVRELFASDTTVGLDTVGTLWVKNYYEKREKPSKVFTNFKSVSDDLQFEDIPEEFYPILERNVKRKVGYFNFDMEKLVKEYEEVFLDSFPLRVEVFDISTLQGEATVASCIVWEKGNFKKNDYRKYKIKSVDGVDDYSSMEEVLIRRFRAIKEGKVPSPSLVVVDGGVGQLNVALKIRDNFGFNFRIFSIAKREEIVYTDDGEVVYTKEHPFLYRFFTLLRDEAHRFAISYNRDLRSKKLKASIFDGIKGLGMKRKKILEKFYPDVKELATVTPSELKKIGIPEKVAVKVIERVKEVFKN